ncbi:hypothetical protein [uncultured Draconibacterium sp.]|uniref:hypothetical protein n=1 Tax=uncultured Draconibacterium sp. TaxID=1573823 RepID=UPI00321742B1
MNINTLAEIIDLFNIEIIKSGFKRDTLDYTNSIGSYQNNIIGLRNIAEKTSIKLDEIYGNDLPEMLNKLFVSKIKPFTNHPHDTAFKDLLNDKEIPQATSFKSLVRFLIN